MWYFLDYGSVKDNFIKYKCLSCNIGYSKKLKEELKKKFKDPFRFSNNDINKIILLLRKCVYPHHYMNDWEKFIETTLLEKEEFYNNLNIEEIAYVDYMYRRRAFKDFVIKYFGEYHDLYLKSDTLL